MLDNLLAEMGVRDDEKEFYIAVKEFLNSIDTEILFDSKNIEFLKRILRPDKVIAFVVNWVDDKGNKQKNNGYRVQYNNLNGIYKGGLRFHPSVNLSILKFLAFEQTFKNALTGLPMGGAKGGSDFDPKGKSQNEIKNFCYAFMEKLWPYIGEDIDVPAGDIGVGPNEIRYLYEAYKFYSKKDDCALTGKPIELGGSLCRKEATGYGVVYFALEALKAYKNTDLKDKKVIISGSGNVALYCMEKVIQLGGIVVGMSDSSNSIFCSEGLDFNIMKTLKEINKQRIKYYHEESKEIIVGSPKDLWDIPCDLAFPCATQFEIDDEEAKKIVEGGCIGVFEGANMPCSPNAQEYFINSKVIFGPGKASNAGGVSVSYFEILQRNEPKGWTFKKIDTKLQKTMAGIFNCCNKYASKTENKFDLLLAANNFSFFVLKRVFFLKKEM